MTHGPIVISYCLQIKKTSILSLEAYKYNPINSAVENLLKEYTELSMSNEQTPQQGAELETDIEVIEQAQEAEQEFVELTEDQQRIL